MINKIRNYIYFLLKGWHSIHELPPNIELEVIDENNNVFMAIPTYYPFEMIKKIGDEHKPWGWRGTVIHYEDGKSKWDGGWMIIDHGLNINKIVGWRKFKIVSNGINENK